MSDPFLSTVRGLRAGSTTESLGVQQPPPNALGGEDQAEQPDLENKKDDTPVCMKK